MAVFAEPYCNERDPLLGSMHSWASASMQSSSPQYESSANVQLGPGSQVRIAGNEFRVIALLGEGSFGAVWGATSRGGVEVAIKEILCRSETELQRAAMERQLLQFVGQGPERRSRTRSSSVGREERPTAAAAIRFPALVASEVEALGPDLWQVRLAMTRLQGKPLESLLESALGDQLQLPMCIDGEVVPAPPPQSDNARLVDVCRCVWTLLNQLSPAMEHLASRAYHRDITPRNILVEVHGSNHSFGLVDFGLAVDASHWREEMLTHDIGGDGHYWPTSSWFVLAHGADHLQSFPALQHEYETCLDLHALGITALRCLMELWDHANIDHAWGQVAKLYRLRIAWSRYWDDVARFWQPIFDSFATGGCDALERLKTQYGLGGVHNMVSADLCAVRAALFTVRDAAVIPELRVVCEALLVMIRPGRGRDDNPSWAHVRRVLEGDFSNAGGFEAHSPPPSTAGACMSTRSEVDSARSMTSWQPQVSSPPMLVPRASMVRAV